VTTTVPAATTVTTTAPAPATSSTTSVTTTAAPTTTTPATTTTAPLTFAVTDPSRLTPPDPLPGSGGATGSGCAPGTDQLPDGIWFGLAVEVAEGAIRFDLACFYFGEIAWEKAAEVGEEAPNDVWIVNDNPRIRTVRVGSEATAWGLTCDGEINHQPLVFGDEWPSSESCFVSCPGENCPVWLYINDSLVTEVMEQYFP
jgi:hypothetical protein